IRQHEVEEATVVEVDVDREREVIDRFRRMKRSGRQAQHVPGFEDDLGELELARQPRALLPSKWWLMPAEATVWRDADVVRGPRQRALLGIPPALASRDLQRRRDPRVEVHERKAAAARRQICVDRDPAGKCELALQLCRERGEARIAELDSRDA